MICDMMLIFLLPFFVKWMVMMALRKTIVKSWYVTYPCDHSSIRNSYAPASLGPAQCWFWNVFLKKLIKIHKISWYMKKVIKIHKIQNFLKRFGGVKIRSLDPSRRGGSFFSCSFCFFVNPIPETPLSLRPSFARNYYKKKFPQFCFDSKILINFWPDPLELQV